MTSGCVAFRRQLRAVVRLSVICKAWALHPKKASNLRAPQQYDSAEKIGSSDSRTSSSRAVSVSPDSPVRSSSTRMLSSAERGSCVYRSMATFEDIVDAT